jgi:hypothetical protein
VTGEPTAYEKELWHADGRRVPVHVSVLRSRKEPFEATAVVLDLTEVKEKERRSRLLLEDRQRLSQTVQTALLPTLPDGLDGGPLPVVSAYQPGDERLALGGDFYDVVRRPDGRLGLLVGDVCGHGPVAAAVGAACRIAWRTGMLSGADLVVAVGLVDLVLRSEREEEGTFATIVSAIYDSRNGDLELLSAGHPPPLLLDLVAGHRTMVVDQGPLLGVVDRAEHVVNRMGLHDGQALLLYTDGLIEGRARPGSSTRLGDDDSTSSWGTCRRRTSATPSGSSTRRTPAMARRCPTTSPCSSSWPGRWTAWRYSPGARPSPSPAAFRRQPPDGLVRAGGGQPRTPRSRPPTRRASGTRSAAAGSTHRPRPGCRCAWSSSTAGWDRRSRTGLVVGQP